MKNRKCKHIFTLASFCLMLYGAAGCSMVGPTSISMGRADYNEAINKTENEQMLLSVVKGRYDETFSLLQVSGVAANVRFAGNAAIQAGVGPSQNFMGNLIPLSGGVVYEENPTITYAPVQGEQYLRQLMSPIPLDILVLFVRSGLDPEAFLIMLADRINDMRNPDFLGAPSQKPDPRFKRFARLNRELVQAGVIQWVEDPREEVPFAILITGHSPVYLEDVKEYLDLLGITKPSDPSADIVLPVYFGVKGSKSKGVAISTRSTIDLIQILRAAIAVPPEHLAKGLTGPYPKPGLAGQGIRVHASHSKPDNAILGVMHRGYCFYIDENDAPTKRFYMIVRTLWSVSMAAGANQKAAPVLTIPVSR